MTENGGAANAQDDGLSVAENSGDLVATGALDIHEKGVGVLDQTLQLALALFLLREGVQQILCELESRIKSQTYAKNQQMVQYKLKPILTYYF